ncbi:hypothetical protein [Coxiella burnetii]|uniref:Uncharacterized protein n=1 Tax=Coxiella burnetii (strain RSA 493 / Nine Mile phase I) TaxID=227377 RepID=B5QSI0_COXBU|nr:hypothetical protein [Coxiella burnetii]YP_009351858.1 hypothetical protein CBUA0023a [Coxiella burnetii RSA 493]ACI14639.1 hypothetical protein CBUA0023a [Coxiella burnetii RSA 493]MCF2094060.1 hypothetical protein [Coxiella burnetii]MCF2096070.1 hypothetical protein [Coxiella burnetii]MCF2098071.1 hypothetical protein [Coxiella burnetii]MCF2100125.1 hypothetical protein [Coxiella burnetii]
MSFSCFAFPNLGSQYKKRFSIRKLQDMVKEI